LVSRLPAGAGRGPIYRGDLARGFGLQAEAEQLDGRKEVRVAPERARVQVARRRRLHEAILGLLDGLRPLRVELREPAVREQAVVREGSALHEPGQVGPGDLARSGAGELALPLHRLEQRPRAPVPRPLLFVAVRIGAGGELVQPDEPFPRLSIAPLRPEEPEEGVAAQVAAREPIDQVAEQRALLVDLAIAAGPDRPVVDGGVGGRRLRILAGEGPPPRAPPPLSPGGLAP